MLKIIVLEGDETGQELLEQSIRVLDPELLGLELELVHYDLSLEKRRETGNDIVHEAARAMREAAEWMEPYRRQWEQRLDRLDEYLRDTSKSARRARKKK